MRIYVNGDSYTDGVGLGDHIIFPEYPGNMASVNMTKLKAWCNLRPELTKERKLASILKEENRKRCWATHLGNLLDAEVINEAVGGSSMFGILSRTIHDIENLIKEDNRPDMVIIGLTSEERLPIINVNPMLHDDGHWVYTAHPGHIDHLSKTYQNYAKEYWMSHTDAEMLTFFLYECLHLKNYVNSRLGYDPIFLNTSNVFYKYNEIIKDTKIVLLKEVWEMLDFGSIHTDQKSLMDIAKLDGLTACGHFVESGCIKYAKYVAANILKING